MQLKTASAVFAAGLLAAGLGFAAPGRAGQHQQSKTATSNRNNVRVDVTGQVRRYDPGDSFQLALPDARERNFDLNDPNTTVKGVENLKIGETVRVTERRENGRKIITIKPAGNRGTARTDNSGQR